MNEKNVGVYQLENGYWRFCYTITVNGKKKDFKKNKDLYGNPIKTEKAAIKAREAALAQDKLNRNIKLKKQCITFEEIYQEYCEFGRSGKVYTTIKKQDSLWEKPLERKVWKTFYR